MKNYSQDDVVKARGVLIEIATRGETITYTDFASLMGFVWNHRLPEDRRLLGELLGRVSREEYARGRPLLTAVVVRKGEDLPGPGFRGFLDFPESDEFCETEKRRVHDFWAWKS